jgi:hypothetical protein
MSVRRLRGVFGSVLIWAVLWIPLGIVAGAVRYSLTPPYDLISDVNAPPEYPPAFPIIANTAIAFVVWGGVVGLIFALILLGAERKRAVHELSPRRFAAWGALSALGLPLALTGVDWLVSDSVFIGWGFAAMVLLAAVFGATCSVGMLRLAKTPSI